MQVLIHLPTELAVRFRRTIPARSRSNYVQELLEKNLPDTDEVLYQAALQVQAHDDAHPEEMAVHENVLMDGLDPDEGFDIAKLKLLCQK